jgi:hypothetical protein
MVPLISIYVGGALTIIMGVLHTQYYKMFHWKSDFEKISLVSARIFYTIHIALLLLFFMIGIISICYAKELSQSTGLNNGLNLLLSILWLWRFIWQFTYFKRKKGQKLPAIAIILSVLFALLVVSYALPVMYRLLE